MKPTAGVIGGRSSRRGEGYSRMRAARPGTWQKTGNFGPVCLLFGGLETVLKKGLKNGAQKGSKNEPKMVPKSIKLMSEGGPGEMLEKVQKNAQKVTPSDPDFYAPACTAAQF